MAGFELFPAIDLRAGRCVRLHQGDFAAETVYDDDPARVAREFEQAGARWLHVVDLDAARSGAAANLESIRAIIEAVACRVDGGTLSPDMWRRYAPDLSPRLICR